MVRHAVRDRLVWRALLAVAIAVMALVGSSPATGAATGAPANAAQVACSASAWTSTSTYAEGAVVSHGGHQWQAAHWMWPGVEPGVAGTPPWWVPWVDLGRCGPATTTTVPPTTTTTTPGSTTTTTPPSGGVEEAYEATGPWAVTTGTSSAPGTPGVTLYYPTQLGEDGYQHPIITFGTGTGNSCSVNEQWLQHYASWGFAVVCANSAWTGSGQEIWAAAQWLRDQNAVAGSVFFGTLDTDSIGASGGSQGAAGAVNAEILSNGAIESSVGEALVDPWAHIWGPPPDFSQVDAPTLLLSGTADGLTNQGQQTAYYDGIPGPAAKAGSVGSDHNNIGQAGRGLGYTTAWFKYTLEDDQFARRAFVATGGSPAEISTDSGFANWAAKNLP
jgi:hypothetical protein